MSIVKIQGDASGTGEFILTSPNSNSNRTLTLPDTTGTIALTSQLITSGPAFAAYISSNQSVSSSTWTKMAFNTEYFDTDSCYDTSAYRFTPNKAGIYQVNVNGASTSGGGNYFYITVYKNGTRLGVSGIYISGGNSDDPYQSFAALINMNGSTDYLEAYGNTNISGLIFNGGATESHFSAAWIRSN